jgi:hypothetical protein
MTPGTNRRRTIFGAIDLASGRFFYQVARKAVSATFTCFCEHLLAAYPTAPLVAVVCDNVAIHRSKLVKRWLASTRAWWCSTCAATRPSPSPRSRSAGSGPSSAKASIPRRHSRHVPLISGPPRKSCELLSGPT